MSKFFINQNIDEKLSFILNSHKLYYNKNLNQLYM